MTLGKLVVSGYWHGRHARDKLFTFLARSGFASFGVRSLLELPVRLGGTAGIAVGDDVFVGANSWLQVLEVTRGEVALRIGDGTSIAGNCVISAVRSVTLGKRVLLARNVYISDHAHAYRDIGSAVLDQGVESVDRVVIDDGAWLGQNVVVSPGVRIGRGAVVGANSVVRSDVPDYSLAVGAPARVIRQFAPDAQ